MPRLNLSDFEDQINSLTDEQLVSLWRSLSNEKDPQTMPFRQLILDELARRHPAPTRKQKFASSMKGCLGWIFLVVWALISAVLGNLLLYMPSTAPYFVLASETFTKLADPTTESKAAWKMTDYRIFGTPILLPVNQPSTNKVAESPQTYDITFPYWMYGTQTDRQQVNVKGSVTVKVVESSNGWVVQGYVFDPQSPLSFFEQLGAWLLWSALSPLCILVGLIGVEILGSPKWTLIWLGFVIQLVICFYLTNVFFGSYWGVIPGVVLQGILLFFLIVWWKIDHFDDS